MKTEAIQEAFSLAAEMDRENTVMPQAREELKALEASHAEMAKALRGLLSSATNGYRLFPSDAQAIETVLGKAGAL